MSKSANKILNTAEQLFNQHSFVSVGVDLIRDESGCSKTTMYTYFKNKQQLVAEVLKARDQRFRQSLLEYVAEANAYIAVDKIYRWHCDWFQTDHFKGCLFVRAVGESSEQDREMIEISQEHKRWLRQFILEHMSAFKHADAIAELFFNLLEGLISRFLVDGFDQKIADQNHDLLLKFIQAMEN